MHPRNHGHGRAVRVTVDLGQWKLHRRASDMFLANPPGGQWCHLWTCRHHGPLLASSDCVDFDRVRRDECGDHGCPNWRLKWKILAKKGVVRLKMRHISQVDGGLHNVFQVESHPIQKRLDVLKYLTRLALETPR